MCAGEAGAPACQWPPHPGGGLVSNDNGLGHQLASACRVLGHTFSSLDLTIISPILWLGKPRLREVMQLAQGHTAGAWWHVSASLLTSQLPTSSSPHGARPTQEPWHLLRAVPLPCPVVITITVTFESAPTTGRVLCLAVCPYCPPVRNPENQLPPSPCIQGRLSVEATCPGLPRASEGHPKPCVARHCFPMPRTWCARCKYACRVDTSPVALLTPPARPDASAATPGDREAQSPPTTYAT